MSSGVLEDETGDTTVALKDSSQNKDSRKKKHRKSKSKSKKNVRGSTSGMRQTMGSSGNYNAAMNRNTRAFTLKSGDFTSSARVDGANDNDDNVTAAAKAAHSDLQRAHHATVASLASINGKFMVQQLAKASQDLKMQHELRKALEELHAKEQDFLMAVEISDKLSKDNKKLSDEIEELRLQVHELNLDNQILAEKMHAISNSYQQDMNKYQNDLLEHKEIMAQLELELDEKAKLVDELEDKVKITSKDDMNNNGNNKYGNNKYGNNGNNGNNKNKNGGNGGNLGKAFESISQLTSGHLSTALEKELFVKLEQERRRAVEQMESFMEQMDEFDKIKKENTDLKTENEDLQEALKEQLQHQQHIQKAMQEEVIALAARNSNLEHQKDEYAKLLEQRDYEIDLLKQQIYLERKQSVVVARQLHGMSVTSETGQFEDLSKATMMNTMDNMMQDDGNEDGNESEGDYDDTGSDGDNDEGPNDDTNNNNNNINNNNNNNTKKNDEVDLDEINAMIDDMIENDKSRKMTVKENSNINNNNNNNNNNNISNKVGATSAVDDVFVPDVIKEYLHLTASAVKIKYPKITNITSEELIGQAKSLPFFQYHDYMVRIMEKELANLEISKKQQLKEREQLRQMQKKKMQKRKSFLSLFGGWLGNDDENDDNGNGNGNSNNNKMKQDEKDDNEDDNDLIPDTHILSSDDDLHNQDGGAAGIRQESTNSLAMDMENNHEDDHNHHVRNLGSPKGRSRKNTNNLAAENDEDGYQSDGYQSDGNGASKGKQKRHSASRFKQKKKRGVSAHASQRRLAGMK